MEREGPAPLLSLWGRSEGDTLLSRRVSLPSSRALRGIAFIPRLKCGDRSVTLRRWGLGGGMMVGVSGPAATLTPTSTLRCNHTHRNRRLLCEN